MTESHSLECVAGRETGGNMEAKKHHRWRWVLGGALGVVTLLVLIPLFQWQRMGQQRASSLANLRRIAGGFLMYSEDWDGRGMPPATQGKNGAWRTWPGLLRAYVGPESTFSNPANSVKPFHSSVRDPQNRYEIDSSYALNSRLWNTFSPGPFPLDDLELPAQTALFVEAGPMWRNPLDSSGGATAFEKVATLVYTDISDRYMGYVPYPSTHDGRMAVVAADGHGMLVGVAHYRSEDGAHDTVYGRIGESVYNWNGGHPNGATDRPAHE